MTSKPPAPKDPETSPAPRAWKNLLAQALLFVLAAGMTVGLIVAPTLFFPTLSLFEPFGGSPEHHKFAMTLALCAVLLQWASAEAIARLLFCFRSTCPPVLPFELNSSFTKQVYVPALLVGLSTSGVLLLTAVAALDPTWWVPLGTAIAVTQATLRHATKKLKAM